MTMKERGEELVSLCESIVEMCRSRGADGAEVFAMRERMAGIQLERDSMKFTSVTETFGIALRVLKGGRMGFSYTNRTENIEGLIERALSVTRHLPESPINFASPGKYLREDYFHDQRIATLEMREGFEIAEEVISSAKEVSEKVTVASGGLYWGEDLIAISTTEGLSRHEVSTRLGVYLSATYPYGSGLISPGYDTQVVRFLPADVSGVGRRAAEYAVAGANPKPLERVPKKVIFRQEAIGSLFEFLLAPSLYGDKAFKGDSFYSPAGGVNLGDQIMGETISIYEDPLAREGVNSSTMDDEGVPSGRTPLVKAGVLEGYLYTLSSAAEAGAEPTSSAMRAERMSTTRNYHHPPTTIARRLYIDSKDRVNDPLKEAGEAIYVHYILGAHTSNASSGDFSVSSSNLLYVKDGEVKYPVKPLMLAGNMKELMKNICCLGGKRKEVPGSLTAVGLSTPEFVVEGVRIIT